MTQIPKGYIYLGTGDCGEKAYINFHATSQKRYLEIDLQGNLYYHA